MSMRSALRHAAACAAIAVVTLLGSAPANGQQPDTATVRVRQVAGTNVYLDIGTMHGLAAGDTIAVQGESGAPLGRLEVVAASEERSVLAFVGESFAVQGGSVLILALLRSPTAVPPTDTRAPAAGAAGAAGAGPRRESTSVRARRSPYGTVSLELAGMRSRTRVGRSDPIDITRTFTTPSLQANVTVPDAFAGFTLRLSGRADYRHSDPGIIRPDGSVRIYRASLERTFDSVPLRLELGRLRNSAESYSGYTDGLLARYGGRAAGAGIMIGLQPDRWNQAFSAARPKLTAFLDGERRGPEWWWSGSASAHLVAEGDGALEHRYVGVSQRFGLGNLQLSQDLQVDEDPASGGVRVSHARAQASLGLARGWRMDAGITTGRRYRDYLTESVFGNRSDRLYIGLARRTGTSGFGVQATLADGEAIPRSSALQVYADHAEPTRIPFGGRINASISRSDLGTVVSVTPGLFTGWRRGRLSAGYRFYRSDYLSRITTQHGADASADLPIGRDLRLAVQLRLGFSSVLSSQALRLQLSRSF